MRWNQNIGWDYCVGVSIYPNDGLRSVLDDRIQKAEKYFYKYLCIDEIEGNFKPAPCQGSINFK